MMFNLFAAALRQALPTQIYSPLRTASFKILETPKRFASLQELERSMGWSLKKHKVTPKPENLEAMVTNLVTAEASRLVTVPRKLFTAPLRVDLLHRAVVWQLACRRQGTHMVRHRSLVRGSTRKIKPQKGGGARHGSIRAPIFVGGGKAHGPVMRSHATRLNQKTISLATRVALSTKWAQGNLEIIEDAEVPTHKTQDLLKAFQKNQWTHSVLVVTGDEVPRNIKLAAQNIPFVKVLPRYEVNVYDILKHEKLVLTVDAVNYLEMMFRNDPMKY